VRIAIQFNMPTDVVRKRGKSHPVHFDPWQNARKQLWNQVLSTMEERRRDTMRLSVSGEIQVAAHKIPDRRLYGDPMER